MELILLLNNLIFQNSKKWTKCLLMYKLLRIKKYSQFICLSRIKSPMNGFNLFLIKSYNNNDYNLENGTCNNSHYCFIKNINRLLSNEVSKNNSKFVRIWCRTHYYEKSKYEEHLKECGNYKPLLFKPPSKGYIKFEHIERSQKIPYTIFADLESIIKKYNLDTNNPNYLWTENKRKHIVSGFCYIVVDWKRNILNIKKYIGYKAGKKFNEYVIKKCDELINSEDKKIKPLTEERWHVYNLSESCLRRICFN